MSKGRHLALYLLTPFVLFAIACASVPPPSGRIAAAETAIRQAESAGAVELAPLQMRIAREKLDDARALVLTDEDNRMSRAARLADEAIVEAQLAEQTARAELAKKSRDEAQRTIDLMRREAGLDSN